MISVAFHTLHAVICVRTSCYCFVHIKDKSSSYLGKAVRDSTVQSSLNWHGKWKGRGKRPEEVVRCCLTTAAAASHRKYLWPKGRGVVPLPVLCPLQCCRPVCRVLQPRHMPLKKAWDIGAKQWIMHCDYICTGQESCRLDAVFEVTEMIQVGGEQTAFKTLLAASTANFTACSVHHDFFIAASLSI